MIKIDIPSPLLDFLLAHEIFCVAGCCADEAFDFSAQAIAQNRWTEEVIAKLDLDGVRGQLTALRIRGKDDDSGVFNAQINHGWCSAAELEDWCAMINDLITSCDAHLKRTVRLSGSLRDNH